MSGATIHPVPHHKDLGVTHIPFSLPFPKSKPPPSPGISLKSILFSLTQFPTTWFKWPLFLKWMAALFWESLHLPSPLHPGHSATSWFGNVTQTMSAVKVLSVATITQHKDSVLCAVHKLLTALTSASGSGCVSYHLPPPFLPPSTNSTLCCHMVVRCSTPHPPDLFVYSTPVHPPDLKYYSSRSSLFPQLTVKTWTLLQSACQQFVVCNVFSPHPHPRLLTP